MKLSVVHVIRILPLVLISLILAIFANLSRYLHLTLPPDWELATFGDLSTTLGRLLADFNFSFSPPAPLIFIGGCLLIGFFIFTTFRFLRPKNIIPIFGVAVLTTIIYLLIYFYKISFNFADFSQFRFLLKLAFKSIGTTLFLFSLFGSGFYFFKNVFPKLSTLKKHLVYILGAALILETVIFNFRFFTTFFYRPIDITKQMIVQGDNIIVDNNRNYTFWGEFGTLIFPNLDVHLDNIYLDFQPTFNNADSRFVLSIATAGDGHESTSSNALATHGTGQDIVLTTTNQRTHFITTHLTPVGNTKYLQVHIKESFNQSFHLNGIYLNHPYPWIFSLARFVFVLVMLLAVYFVWTARTAHYPTLENLKRSKHWLLGLITVQLLLLSILVQVNNTLIVDQIGTYNELAQAFAAGKVDLGPAPDFITKLHNPYDDSLRPHFSAYKFDFAYYAGNYYVYFGAAPVLLLYLPYYLLTGQDLSGSVASFIFSAVSIVGLNLFLYFFVRRRFPKTSIVIWQVLSWLILATSLILSLALRPDVYNLVMIAGLAFCFLGLACFELAFGRQKSPKATKKQFIFTLLGSLSLALVAGGRPQLLLFSFAVLIYYLWPLIKNKILFTKNYRQLLIAITLPFFIIGSLCMWYNYVRFASPFNFGATYNLTLNDMTHYGFVWERLPLAIYLYLLRLPAFDNQTLLAEHADYVYQGFLFDESHFGGLLTSYLWLWPLFLLPFLAFGLKKNKLWWPVVILFLMGVFIAILDLQVAGIAGRYFADFALLYALAATAVWLHLFEFYKNNYTLTKLLYLFFCIALVAAFVFAIPSAAAQVSRFGSAKWLEWLSTLIFFAR